MTEKKRIDLMRMIANADDAGINRLWRRVNNAPDDTITREQLKKASGEVFADSILENPAKLIIATDIIDALTAVEYKLFEKEE